MWDPELAVISLTKNPVAAGLRLIFAKPLGCCSGGRWDLRPWPSGDDQETHLLKPKKYFVKSKPARLDQRKQPGRASPSRARLPNWRGQSIDHSQRTNPSPGRRLAALDPKGRYGLPSPHGYDI